MTTLSYGSQGQILRVVGSSVEAAMYDGPPAGLAGLLEYDPATNEALDEAIRSDPTPYRVVGGALQKDGQPVQVAAESEASADAREMASIIDAIRTYLAASGNQRTDAQRMAFERNVGRVLRHLVRRAG